MSTPETHPELVENDDFELPADIFEEPKDFRPPTPVCSASLLSVSHFTLIMYPIHLQPPTFEDYTRESEYLWNAGLSMTKYLDKHKDLCIGKRVLELGAAASLPSIICTINGANKVVITDYPDPELLNNMQFNANANAPDALAKGIIKIEGFQWGQPPDYLFEALGGPDERFDLILLADLIFNHNQHVQLLDSCKACIAPGGQVITTFTHHVVKWLDRDLKFFELAVAEPFNFKVEKLYEETWTPMFPDDSGDERVRATVHAFRLTLD
ncbi:nicotinamide n-methyltransferase [Borealophlyctis nickersoniae]|nr:nicotinamide n-methyltransferase [Borealophlyctis nickersoniae]